jgi:hypothetical protein
MLVYAFSVFGHGAAMMQGFITDFLQRINNESSLL